VNQTEQYRHFATVLDEQGDKTILHVYGDVDLVYADEFEAAMHEGAAGGTLIVDLQECSYMDSTGLTALVRVVRRHGDRVHAVVTQGSTVARILQLTAFHDVLRIAYVERVSLWQSLDKSAKISKI